MGNPAPTLSSLALLRAGFHLATRHMELFLLLSALFGLLMGLASLPLLAQAQTLLTLGQQDLSTVDIGKLMAPLLPYLIANLLLAPPFTVLWVRVIRLTPSLALRGGGAALLRRSLTVLMQAGIAILIFFLTTVPVVLLAGLLGVLFGSAGPTISVLAAFSATLVIGAGLSGLLALCATDIGVDQPMTLLRVLDRCRPRLGLMIATSLLVMFILLGLLQGIGVVLPPIGAGPDIALVSTIIGEALRAMSFAVLVAAFVAARPLLLGNDDPPADRDGRSSPG